MLLGKGFNNLRQQLVERSQKKMSNPVDVLFEIRNAFFTGNFQHCITEAQRIKPPSAAVAVERDVLMYRSYIAQKKYAVVLEEVQSSSPGEVQAVRLLAEYFHSPIKRESIIKQVEGKLSSGVEATNDTFILMSASMYLHQQNYDSCLRCLNLSDSLEGGTMRVQVYLAMHRVDLAKKEVKALQEKDDDATLTQLALAWFNLAVGGEKYQDAFYIFQEMADKTTPTSLLLNGQASCYLMQGKLDDAEGVLMEALSKDSNNPETLINLVVVSQLMGKPQEISNRYLSQLKDGCSDHDFVLDFNNKEALFDRLAQQYTPAVLYKILSVPGMQHVSRKALGPLAVIVLCGKRKCGKDYVAEKLRCMMDNDVCIVRLSKPLKEQYAKDHDLDIQQLMDSSPYKETYRHDMIVWSESTRDKDPGYFCRLAVSDATRPVWLVSDARRESDMQFFQEEHGAALLTVRVQASEETRKARGWVYNKQVDDSISECGLDGYKCQVNINNNVSEENLALQLNQIVGWVKMMM